MTRVDLPQEIYSIPELEQSVRAFAEFGEFRLELLPEARTRVTLHRVRAPLAADRVMAEFLNHALEASARVRLA